MNDTPPQEVIDAIEAGTTQIIRRLEFYENDASTLWLPGGTDRSRLVDGTVSIDATRDERRTVDLSLSSIDGALRPNAYGGLWYDKVLKPFRGVRYPADRRPPKVAIVDAVDNTQAYSFRQILTSIGYTRTDVRLDINTIDQLGDYEVVVSARSGLAPSKPQLLSDAFGMGKRVFSQGNDSTQTQIPLIAATTASAGASYAITPPTYDTPLSNGWSAETAGTEVGNVITAVSGGTTIVATMDVSGTARPSALIQANDRGGRWFHIQSYGTGTQHKTLFRKALDWLHNYQPYKNWEVQVGEFLIDNITEDHFPNQTKITGRDYTKMLLNSKITESASFEAGTPLIDFIRAIAANGGVKKFKLPVITSQLNTRLDFERGTERWNLIKDAAAAAKCVPYFDNQGYLTLKRRTDPSFDPIGMTFQTGPSGNLSSYSRSVNDSQIYNHVVVYGDPGEGEERLPYYGEAKNNEPSSSTRIDRIGDRLYTYASTFFTSDTQCQAYAESLLKMVALEPYEINFASSNYPWLEAGIVAEILDPDRLEIDETRFMLTSITLPLGLGLMSATARRITFVGEGEEAVA